VRVVLEHTDGRTVDSFGHPDEQLFRAVLKALVLGISQAAGA
jgi:hypothetical protein